MNADNLVKVLRSYRRVHPDLRPINAADNDCWKLLSQPDVASKLPVVSSEIGDTWLYVEKHILV